MTLNIANDVGGGVYTANPGVNRRIIKKKKKWYDF